MQPFWMAVGLRISIAAREAMSHGATSKEAKLDFASTTLPLLIIDPSISGGPLLWACSTRDLIRDVDGVHIFEGRPSDSSLSGEDSFCLFFELPVDTFAYGVSDDEFVESTSMLRDSRMNDFGA